MALTEGPKALVSSSLIAPPEPPADDRDPVEVRMVHDAQGYTYHERRPRLVEGKAGETLTVSRSLAALWAASGRCVLFAVEEPKPAAALPEASLEEESSVPAAEPKAAPKKRRRRRK